MKKAPRFSRQRKKTESESFPPLRLPAVDKDFSVVCIGASAGGLESVTRMLKHLPPDTGMAFVLVQHLDPSHESAMASLLSSATKMRVAEARANEQLLPNCVYIIPPNKLMELSGMKLKLFPRKQSVNDRAPVDWFMRSAAEALGTRTIGIVLSGTGTDGTQGLLAIKAAGGITFAESPRTAKYPGMPGSAVTAGCVDFVLTPEKIARELKPLSRRARPAIEDGDEGESGSSEQRGFEAILLLLRQRHGVDFTYYKHATLRRRIHRRMVLNKLDSLKDYAAHLRSHPAETKELFNDILIHVTGFFRDAMVFQTLRKKLLPRLIRNKAPEDPLRIWIPGCSTGEEVYSIAILLLEFMSERKVHHPVQIFGTDINDLALERARAGLYSEGVVSDISPDRLRRFFFKTDGGYRVNKTVREMCIFARQNLVNDPPFSNLDLISCRNVLIYLGPALQRKVMPVFHYALRENGLLMLGASETIGGYADLFALVDSKAKVYVKKGVQVRPAVTFAHGVIEPPMVREHKVAAQAPAAPTITDVQKQADRIILANYSLPGVVINKQMEVLQFRGRTGPFLEHFHGEASLHLLKMAREGLGLELRAAVTKAIKQNTRVRHEGARVKQNGHTLECNIEIIPFSPPPATERFYLVMFETVLPEVEAGRSRLKKETVVSKVRENAEVIHLREDLAATRESLQAIIEEQEATNEELRSANEEIMSSNEELQSTNEELETAKEELQSTNEELTTLNDELESRNGELERVNNDLHNLLASVNIPILILDADVRIRRFTGLAEKLFKLIPSDIGRPITDINLPLEIPSLGKLVLEVFDTLTPKDFELQDKQGHWWSVRVRPYKTTDRKIDGAVLALVDIDNMKTGIERLAKAREVVEAMVNAVREPVLMLDRHLTVTSANAPFYRMFKVTPEEVLNRPVYDLDDRQWDIAPLRKQLDNVLLRRSGFEDFAIEYDFPRAGRKRILINARFVDQESDQLIILAINEAN
ncbi:MAG TPA: chemotaxis protein CheB [Verrucomicrobiae bacterium]|nr:chemotaxis protein CheB [Verrucomicrobiae bacterium]